MSEIRIIENGIECEAAELLCIKCYHRWIGTYHAKAALKDLECSNCGHIGLIIKTGQTMYIDRSFEPEQEEDVPEESQNETEIN